MCTDAVWLWILQPRGNYFWLGWKLDPKAQAELNFGRVSQFSNAFHWKPWLRKESMHGSISSLCVILLSSALQNIEQGIRPHSNECISPEHLWIWLAWSVLLWTAPGRGGRELAVSLSLFPYWDCSKAELAHGDALNCLCMEKRGRGWENRKEYKCYLYFISVFPSPCFQQDTHIPWNNNFSFSSALLKNPDLPDTLTVFIWKRWHEILSLRAGSTPYLPENLRLWNSLFPVIRTPNADVQLSRAFWEL